MRDPLAWLSHAEWVPAYSVARREEMQHGPPPRRSNAVNYTLNSARVCRTCSRWAREELEDFQKYVGKAPGSFGSLGDALQKKLATVDKK